jgi:hypothetical protein
MVQLADETLLSGRTVSQGDIIGVVAGTQSSTGSTNFIRLHRVVGNGATKAGPRKKKSPRR